MTFFAPGKVERIDWYEVYRRLVHGSAGLRPWEIPKLTIAELVLCLDDDMETRRLPGAPVSPAEAQEYAERRWRMSRREKIDASRSRKW